MKKAFAILGGFLAGIVQILLILLIVLCVRDYLERPPAAAAPGDPATGLASTTEHISGSAPETTEPVPGETGQSEPAGETGPTETADTSGTAGATETHPFEQVGKVAEPSPGEYTVRCFDYPSELWIGDLDYLQTVIDEARRNSSLFPVRRRYNTGYDFTWFNAAGEVYIARLQDPEFLVCRSDGTAIRFTGGTPAAVLYVEPLKMIENTLGYLRELPETVEFRKGCGMTEDGMLFTGYEIHLSGTHAIRSMFQGLSEKDIDKFVIPLSGPDADVVLSIYIDETDQFRFRIAPSLAPDKTVSTVMPLMMYDWKLSREWYTDQIAKRNVAFDQLRTLTALMDKQLERYAEEYGVDAGELFELSQ